jgi:acetyl esterase/lipase
MQSRRARAAGIALAAFSIALTSVSSIAAGAPPLVPVKDFARKSDFESAKISPNGDYLAVAIPSGDQTMLGIIDLKNMKISGHLRFIRGEHVYQYWWVGPERVVVSIARSAGPLDQLRYTGELYGMNADGSGKGYLFGYRGGQEVSKVATVVAANAWADILDPLPHDPQWALISVTPWIRMEEGSPLIERLNVLNGKRRRLHVLPGYEPFDAVADRSGRVRLAYSHDRNSAPHLYVPDDSAQEWRELPHPKGPPVSLDLHGVSADGESVFLTSGDQDGRRCLREHRPADDSLVELRCNDAARMGAPVFALDERRPIGMLYEAGKPEFDFFDANHPDVRLRLSLMKAFGDMRVAITSSTLDGKKLMVAVDGDRSPGDFFLVDRATRKAGYLMSQRPWIDPAAMAPSAPLQYRTRDGATVHGYLTARDGLATRKAPLVLMPHGGPHGIRDSWEWDPWAQLLANRGYAVLQVNYRGSGGYGDRFMEAGYRKWGTLMQDDLTDAVRWAIDQGIADASRVCIMGGSYGGYAALMSATREPDLYRCAISLAGVYDLEAHAADSDIADSRYGRNYLEKTLGDKALMREHSPITHIEKLKAPVLIAHGTLDKRVRFGQAKALRRALERHKKAYEWLEFEGEEHGFYIDANHEAFLNKALEFLDRYIGPQSQTATAPGN